MATQVRRMRLDRRLSIPKLARLVRYHCETDGPGIDWVACLESIEDGEFHFYLFTLSAIVKALHRARPISDYERFRWRCQVCDRKRADTPSCNASGDKPPDDGTLT